MSHFSVMVITSEEPSMELLRKVLAPYHEFECTGDNDEYVVEVEEIEEYKKAFKENTRKHFKSPDGELFWTYEDQFYRDPTEEEIKTIGPLFGSGVGEGISWHSKDWGDGRGYRVKVHFTPEGYELVDVPINELMSFTEYVIDQIGEGKIIGEEKTPDTENVHKYSYACRNKEGEIISVIRRTNPNAKWDWWVVGGRFDKRLMTKDGARTSCARFDDIDWIKIRKEIADKAVEKWDMVHECIGEDLLAKHIPWKECLQQASEDIAAAREIYNNQESVQRKKSFDPSGEIVWVNLDDFLCFREEYYNEAYNSAIQTFAVVKNGEWYERGEMGWWANVTNENENWTTDFHNLIEDTPQTHWVTIVDCHI